MTGRPLARIVTMLDDAEIPHMLAGSFASSFHGDPRTTRDIDLVIDPARDALVYFVRGIDPDQCYVSEPAAMEASDRRGRFIVIFLDSGWKVDLILRKDRDFSRPEFERRQEAIVEETAVFVATAEDTIVSKLEWARSGESERQMRDVAGIVGVRADSLDVDYVERRVRALGLDALRQRALRANENGAPG